MEARDLFSCPMLGTTSELPVAVGAAQGTAYRGALDGHVDHTRQSTSTATLSFIGAQVPVPGPFAGSTPAKGPLQVDLAAVLALRAMLLRALRGAKPFPQPETAIASSAFILWVWSSLLRLHPLTCHIARDVAVALMLCETTIMSGH